MVQLRGILFVHIVSAKKLYNADSLFFGLTKNKSDPYVKVKVGNTRICKSSIIQDTSDPKWDEYFLVDVCHEGDTLDIQVLDKDLLGKDDLGILQIPLQRIIERKEVQGEYYLVRNGEKSSGRLTFHLQLFSTDDVDRTRKVPNCYFAQHRSCKVTLYQDACTNSNALTDALGYKPPNAFKDITDMINGAEKFIYITGWSVKTGTRLERVDPNSETLGELLIRKADQGVKVVAIVWDEITSTELTPGLMGTYDQQTYEYFKDTAVNLIISAREKRLTAKSIIESELSATVYTHHQKTVICDVEGDGQKKRIAAFVGGLDLTCGRYDTADHHIFKTLVTEHKGDFYNGSASLKVTECGPRQPWHDIHCKIEGSAAMDVMKNFEERWKRQNKHEVDKLYQIPESEFDLSNKMFEGDDRWNVQVLRSISDNSAVFDYGKSKNKILMVHTDTVYDNSIHKAYIHQIRRSTQFIYIENQYFLGSSHFWGKTHVKHAVHLIPVEIAMRIVDAIGRGEQFCVYVVLPLHPEGDPGSISIQDILWYQYKTIDMMYKLIAKALNSAKSANKPTDYLSFFCLGKRQHIDDIPTADIPDPAPDTKEAVLRSSRRFMIYVHSKMAIFDDDYIIVGSANINQRSMSGKRDTEIAIGACQINEKCSEDGTPKADISVFRKSLMIEHTGKNLSEIDTPGDIESMRALRVEAMNNWNAYASESDQPEGHLLLYPITVSDDGSVSSITEFFPDSDAKIIGTKGILPEKITT